MYQDTTFTLVVFYHTSSCTLLCFHRRCVRLRSSMRQNSCSFMCVRVRSSSIRQTNLLLHTRTSAIYIRVHGSVRQIAVTYCINEGTNRHTRTLLYFKMRNVYQMALVLSSNDNDGYWHHLQASSLNRYQGMATRMKALLIRTELSASC